MGWTASNRPGQFRPLPRPAANRIGAEDEGFRHRPDGLDGGRGHRRLLGEGRPSPANTKEYGLGKQLAALKESRRWQFAWPTGYDLAE